MRPRISRRRRRRHAHRHRVPGRDLPGHGGERETRVTPALIEAREGSLLGGRTQRVRVGTLRVRRPETSTLRRRPVRRLKGATCQAMAVSRRCSVRWRSISSEPERSERPPRVGARVYGSTRTPGIFAISNAAPTCAMPWPIPSNHQRTRAPKTCPAGARAGGRSLCPLRSRPSHLGVGVPSDVLKVDNGWHLSAFVNFEYVARDPRAWERPLAERRARRGIGWRDSSSLSIGGARGVEGGRAPSPIGFQCTKA